MGLMDQGWLGPVDDPDLAAWAKAATGPALDAAQDPNIRAAWLRHGGTWFAGVNALPNDGQGCVADSGPLQGALVDDLRKIHGEFEWDPAQVSVVYPGYPKQDATETDAAHRFRLNRDAAHVDGLLPEGPNRRRFLREFHGFVLGLPITAADAGASPMVVWEGSHHIMREAFASAFEGIPSKDWINVDLTQIYAAARKKCFVVCKRVIIHANPGQAYVLHRHALHGVAPWAAGAKADPQGRVILYFRPELSGGAQDWMLLP